MQKLNNRAILEEQKSKIKTQLLDKQAYLAALKQRKEQKGVISMKGKNRPSLII